MLSGAFFKKKKLKLNTFKLPTFPDAIKMLTTYIAVAFGLIIFRSPSLNDVLINISSLFKSWSVPFLHFSTIGFISIGLLLLFIHDYSRCFNVWPRLLSMPRWVIVACYIILILLMGAFNNKQFIYFQF